MPQTPQYDIVAIGIIVCMIELETVTESREEWTRAGVRKWDLTRRIQLVGDLVAKHTS